MIVERRPNKGHIEYSNTFGCFYRFTLIFEFEHCNFNIIVILYGWAMGRDNRPLPVFLKGAYMYTEKWSRNKDESTKLLNLPN